MTGIEITLTDLKEARQILDACLTLLTARDIMEAQARLQPHRPSSLALEVERVKIRMDSYMADHLLALEDAAEEEEPVNDPGPEEEEEEEELSSEPLGSHAFPRQRGRRISPDELTAREVRLGAPTEIVRDEE